MTTTDVTVHVLRVFTDARGRYGNPLGVVMAGAQVPVAARQRFAARLGYSETVFVNDADTGEVQIFTPAAEIALPGHPLVGTAWLLAVEGTRPPECLRPVRVRDPVPCGVLPGPDAGPPAGPPAGQGSAAPLGARFDADPATTPDWEIVQLADPAAVVAAVAPEPGGHWQNTLVWAWSDEAAGTVRVRTFAWQWGVEEDEACGSAVVRLAAVLGRGVEALSGRGSVIGTEVLPDGLVRIGGRVVLDTRRFEPLPGLNVPD